VFRANETILACIAKVDKALYAAKANGRNQIQVYEFLNE